MLHSRKELRRNTERDGAEGRRASGRGEKKREGGEKERECRLSPLFAFSFALSQALKRCLIWSVGSREVDSFLGFFFFFAHHQQTIFPPLSLPLKLFSNHLLPTCIAITLCDISQSHGGRAPPPTGVPLVKRTPISTLWCFTVLLVDLVHTWIIHARRLQLLLVNCQWPLSGGGGALHQKRNSDLRCCFSCFYAGPERAVHTTRDGPPGPRQPDPSHREKRYVFVTSQRFPPLHVWPSSSHHLPVAVTPALESVDVWACGSSQALTQMHPGSFF